MKKVTFILWVMFMIFLMTPTNNSSGDFWLEPEREKGPPIQLFEDIKFEREQAEERLRPQRELDELDALIGVLTIEEE